MSRRSVASALIGVTLMVLSAAGLASCARVDVNILPGTRLITVRPPEKQRPPPLTREGIRGTACATGELPAPRCLSYRSRAFDELCRGPRAASFKSDCDELRTDLPLPPGPRERRPLLPPR